MPVVLVFLCKYLLIELMRNVVIIILKMYYYYTMCAAEVNFINLQFKAIIRLSHRRNRLETFMSIADLRNTTELWAGSGRSMARVVRRVTAAAAAIARSYLLRPTTSVQRSH